MKRVSIPAERENWDNFSEDITYEPPEPETNKLKSLLKEISPPPAEPVAYESVERCVQACKDMPECFQYTYTDQKCRLQKTFRFGQRKDPDGDKRWKSGWDLDKIQKFKEEHVPCKAVDYTSYHQ